MVGFFKSEDQFLKIMFHVCVHTRVCRVRVCVHVRARAGTYTYT